MLNYIEGNLFENIPLDKVVIIPHVCNNIGGWGSGFVVPLEKAYPKAAEDYRSKTSYILGEVQFVRVVNVFIANMIGQNGVRGSNNPHPLIYDALQKAMRRVKYFAQDLKFLLDGKKELEILAPQFGCGLAGGDWNIVEQMIKDYWAEEFAVTVFKYG